MVRGQQRLAVPNPHRDQEIGRPLLGERLRQAGISRDAWDALQPASAKAPGVGRYHQPPATAHAGTARPSWGVPAIMGCPGRAITRGPRRSLEPAAHPADTPGG